MAQPSHPLKANASGTSPFRSIDSPDRLAYLAPQVGVNPIDRSRRREAHLPAQQARSQASARFPRAHGDRRRPPGAGGAAGKGAQTAVGLSPVAAPVLGTAPDSPVRLTTLKTRAEFVRVAASRQKAVTPGLILQMAMRPAEAGYRGVRVGFTASRKVGNAVLRNRAKRRLRAAAAHLLARQGQPLTDYVLIARQLTASRAFAALLNDLETALRRVGHNVQRRLPTVPKE
jgi:ribonuclease P protein component